MRPVWQKSSNQLVLPFAEREYIDIRRTGRILGLSHSGIRYLYQRGLIEIIDFRHGGRKRVKYQSVVDLCDTLRERHCIADRRPKLTHPIFRHRDEDLLPFPLTDTLSIPDANQIMGYDSSTTVRYLCEEAAFDAYQLTDISPWRISRQSLAEYLQSQRNKARMPAV